MENFEDMDTNTLMDMRDQYQKDLDGLYDADISDEDYWSAFHHCNAQIKNIEKELRERKII